MLRWPGKGSNIVGVSILCPYNSTAGDSWISTLATSVSACCMGGALLESTEVPLSWGPAPPSNSGLRLARSPVLLRRLTIHQPSPISKMPTAAPAAPPAMSLIRVDALEETVEEVGVLKTVEEAGALKTVLEGFEEAEVLNEAEVTEVTKVMALPQQTEIVSLPQPSAFGSLRHVYTRPVIELVYWSKNMGEGLQPNIPASHGFPVVSSPSTTAQTLL